MNDEVVPAIVFMIGRMNPPTPGHVKLAEEVLKIANEKGGIPRIYLTTSLNPPDIAHRISYLTNNPKDGLSRKRAKDNTVVKNPLYVKHPKAQNPLTVDLKKRFLIDMLVYRKQGSDEEKQQFRDDLDKIVVTNCARRGPMSAMWCAAMEQLGWPTEEQYDPINIDPNKLFYVMGGEVDPKEKEGREKYCANEENGPAIWDKDPRLSCVILQRTEDEDQEDSADAEEVNLESMSGSKVRLLVGCEPENREQARDTFDKVYRNYLSPDQRSDLYDAITEGLFGIIECPTDMEITTKKPKQTAGTKKRGHRKIHNNLKKTRRGKKKTDSIKGKGKSNHNNRRKRKTRRANKLLKPNIRKRHSTRRK
jgi:hypothetical protein